MRVSSFPLILLVLAACGGNDRDGRNYVILRDSSVSRPDAVEPQEDASEDDEAGVGDRGVFDAGEDETFDADGPRDADGFPDARTFPDAGFPDANNPPPFDAGRPDIGVPGFPDASGPFDAGRPDAGRPDAGRPDSGQTDSGTPPAFQTTVSLTPGTAFVTLNLQPPVAADPLSFSSELTYDNVGPGSQVISVTNVEVSAIILPIQTFVAGPAYNAPVGFTTNTISKSPGTAAAITAPETYCGLPAIVYIDLSNGQQLTDISVVSCVQ